MRILLVEDDTLVADFEKRLFKDHEVTHVESLHDALTADITLHIKENVKFDLVVLDLKIPVRSQPGTYHPPEEVLKVMDARFKGIPIVVISAFLDKGVRDLISSYNMTCIDKDLLKETQSFLNMFFSFAEASGKMRSVAFAEHMSTGAILCAENNNNASSEMDRMKAKLYLMAGVSVLLLPWALLIFSAYCKVVLKDDTPLPYYTHMLFFCAVGAGSILGILPWILKFLGKDTK